MDYYNSQLHGYDNMRQDWRDNGCPGDPPGLDSQYRSIPAPNPNLLRPGWNPMVPIAGGGAALYLLYRLLRLLPSLLPPFWPTAPANALLP